MTIKDLKKLKVKVYKTAEFTLKNYLSNDPHIEVNNYLNTFINDIEYDSGKKFSDLSKEDVIEYLERYIFDENILDEILAEYYPEIEIK